MPAQNRGLHLAGGPVRGTSASSRSAAGAGGLAGRGVTYLVSGESRELPAGWRRPDSPLLKRLPQ